MICYGRKNLVIAKTIMIMTVHDGIRLQKNKNKNKTIETEGEKGHIVNIL